MLKVRDQIPISEDEKIEVKLQEPALSRGDKERVGKAGPNSESVVVKTKEQRCKVTAQWDSVDVTDTTHSGEDGKILWTCEDIPSQAQITLYLRWEVSCPSGMSIQGIDAE